ncbi:ATP-binding cassette domain-containing protein [Paenibacillus alkalitolerans]|uniref:ATP-binding cassette domain-containing protein n=1 Tax=Paenibacillus alkalitolerans TaxID=2799335 RepID=UPI0018F79CAE|nr:ATP-binding cassette domain-containing protein [Paenibacillus alkalitolerans]
MNNNKLDIAVYGLTKNYRGSSNGLNGLNMEVPRGKVHGLLGPNGAGKTTTVKILSTLLEADAGEAYVSGYNVSTQAREVRERIGLVGQYAALDEILTGRQNLVMFGRLSRLSPRQARKRADDLLEWFGLAGSGNMPVGKYSGGMRRRLDLAASLIVSPSVLFVDEPTTGLDPLGRKEVWGAIRSLADEGATVLLTTQYLEEADLLADRISILKEGRIIAEGTADELKSVYGGDRLEITMSGEADTRKAVETIAKVIPAKPFVDEASHRIHVPVNNRTEALLKAAAALSEARLDPVDIAVRRPSLDEVFIDLTGSPAVSTQNKGAI